MGVCPVVAGIHIDLQGYAQVPDIFHDIPYQCSYVVELVRWDLKDDLIMDRQEHGTAVALFCDGFVHLYHRQLDQVGRSPLNGSVGGNSFGKPPQVAVVAVDIGYEPDSS